MPVALSPAARVIRASLYTYLHPRLAMDAKNSVDYNAIVRGVTSRNYTARRPLVEKAVRQATDGRLAYDNGISDLAALLSALSPQVAEADQAPGLGQIASAPGGSAGPMTATPSPDQGGGDLAKIKAYLEQEGVAPEIINNIDSFMAQHAPAGPAGLPGPGGPGDSAQDRIVPRTQPGQDQESGEEIEGEPGSEAMREMGPRGGTDGDVQSGEAIDEEPDPWRDQTTEGEDEEVPGEQSEQLDGVSKVSSEGTPSRVVNGAGGQDRMPVSRAAMDKAIKLAQDRAIHNQRQIRDAERYVRGWVGDLAMDANGPADVYRAALKALGVKGVERVHPDALKPILDAQPKPGVRVVQDRLQLAQDSSKVEGDFASRFPDAMKITIQ